MKDNKHIIALFFASILLMFSCTSNSSNTSAVYDEAEDSEALPYGATDTIQGEVVSIECATVNFDFERLLNRVNRIASPYMLMDVKATFQHDIDSLSAIASNLPAEENKLLQPTIEEIKSEYKSKCREYEIPADGVISNLNSCISQLRQVQNRQQLESFIDLQWSVVRSLDILHLCVESRSPRISEVKRLASQLQSELDSKKKKYGIN